MALIVSSKIRLPTRGKAACDPVKHADETAPSGIRDRHRTCVVRPSMCRCGRRCDGWQHRGEISQHVGVEVDHIISQHVRVEVDHVMSQHVPTLHVALVIAYILLLTTHYSLLITHCACTYCFLLNTTHSFSSPATSGTIAWSTHRATQRRHPMPQSP